MGLIKHLLFWPVTAPQFLTEFSIKQVHGAVRKELTDETAVKEELMELQLSLEMGEVDEDEYVDRESELMQKLREVREWRERFGMATSGGLVRVAGTDEAEREAPGATEPTGAADEREGGDREPGEPADEEAVPEVASADAAEVEVTFESDEDERSG